MSRVDLDLIERGIRDGHCPANGCDDFLPLIAELRLAREVVEWAKRYREVQWLDDATPLYVGNGLDRALRAYDATGGGK